MPDEADEWQAIRSMATNIIGFHELVESDDAKITTARRIQYEAQVYAGGVTLAVKLSQLMERLDD